MQFAIPIYEENGKFSSFLSKFIHVTYKINILSIFGESMNIDGFLKRCDEDKVLLEPAILRDPTAKFSPIKANGI